MIYLGFIFDYAINLFLPISSYFVVNELDDNNLFEVVVIGVLLDTLYGKFFWNLAILLGLYVFSRSIKIKKKYLVYKNVFFYIIYFLLMNILFGYNMNILVSFGSGLLLQLVYMYLVELLVKGA